MAGYLSLGLNYLDFAPARGEALVQRIEQYGIPWIQLHNRLAYENQDELFRLAARLKAAGVHIYALTARVKLNTHPEDQAVVLETIQQVAAIGAPYVGMMYGGHPHLTTDAGLERFAQTIQPCLEMARDCGVVLLIENVFSRPGEPGDITETVGGTRRLFESVNSPYLGLTWDPCNFLIGSGQAYPYGYDELAPFIRYMHLKDATPSGPSSTANIERPLETANGEVWQAVPLGEGSMSLEPLVNRLAEDQFPHVVCLEMFTSSSTHRYLMRSLQWLSSLGINLPGAINQTLHLT